MPVDPDFQAILDRVNALPPPDYGRPAMDIAREMRSAPIVTPPLRDPVTVEARRIPANDGHPIQIRIYRPSTARPHPVIVSMHGGGWVRGSLDSDEFKSHFMAHASGCAVVSVDYRMAPEFRYPVALEDCLAVTEWVRANADSMGFEADRIGVAGDSAGGNLAAALALMTRDRGGPPLRCQILVYPICDHDFDRPSYLENAEGKLLTRAMMQWFWDQYAGPADRDQPYLSPLRSPDLRGLPPALILTAEHDPLRDEGELYARKLQEAGNIVEAQRIDGVIHPFQSLAVLNAKSIRTLEASAAFARRFLLAGDSQSA